MKPGWGTEVKFESAPKVEAYIATMPGREHFLAECVESLREQGIEPIIMSDERWGPYKWNEALDKTTAEFVCFPHDDDIYGPDYIKEMVAVLEKNPEAAAAFCLDKYIDESGGGATDIKGMSFTPFP